MQLVNIIPIMMQILMTETRRGQGDSSKTSVRSKEKGEAMQQQKVQKLWSAAKKGAGKASLTRVIALALMIIITTGAIVPVMASQKPVTIYRDGEQLSSMAFSSEDVLQDPRRYLKNECRIEVAPEDSVEVAEEGASLTIRVRSSIPVAVEADGKTQETRVFYGDTVQTALTKLQIAVGGNDAVNPVPDTIITEETEIAIGRNCALSVTADGETKSAVLPKSTLEKALHAMGIALGEHDEISVPINTILEDGMEVTIARVMYQDVTSTQEVAFQTLEEDDSTMMKGETKVKTEGVNGVRTIVTRQKLVDGVLAGTEEISNEITTLPVDEQVLVGTKEKPKGVASVDSANGTITDVNGNVVRYKSVITGRCTAYTGGGTTSTGVPAAVGRVAVNPNVIPYGTKLYICSPDGKVVYGYAIAADTGGGCMSGLIVSDLYFNTLEECRQFGSRQMSVYILA